MVKSHLRAVVGLFPPHTWMQIDQNNRKVLYGLTSSPFLNITQSLNITVDIEPAKGEWGTYYPDGTTTGMIKSVDDDEVDVALGPFYYDPALALHLPAGEPHQVSEFTFMSGYRNLFKTELTVTPFDSTVSSLLLFVCFFMALLFYITLRRTSGRITLWDAFYLSQSVFLQDPLDNRGFVNPSSRLALVTWSFGSFIIMNVVAGILRSMAAVKTPVQMLDTYQQLVDNPSVKIFAFKGVRTLEMMADLRGRELKILEERNRKINGEVAPADLLSPNLLDLIFETKAVFVQERKSGLAVFPLACNKYKGFLHFGAERMSLFGVWYYSRSLDVETRNLIDKRVRWTNEFGMKWIRDRELYGAPPKCFTFALETNMVGDSETFNFQTLLPFYVLWLIGCTAGILALIGELTVSFVITRYNN